MFGFGLCSTWRKRSWTRNGYLIFRFWTQWINSGVVRFFDGGWDIIAQDTYKGFSGSFLDVEWYSLEQNTLEKNILNKIHPKKKINLIFLLTIRVTSILQNCCLCKNVLKCEQTIGKSI
jgi:hypothetical protein